ncbi:hypothetical protein CFP56_026657 [Quercus suber]|uniref:Uncharacterized protein n=1 Tax=Quercus suber TaxID=58331 RepID=A0AAW0JYZ6_QUESU
MMKLLPGLTRKNAMALHVIQISCEPRVYFVIRRISSAKIAWDTLKAICKIDKSDYDVFVNVSGCPFIYKNKRDRQNFKQAALTLGLLVLLLKG